jgi:alpha/beta superfamily hydrolase
VAISLPSSHGVEAVRFETSDHVLLEGELRLPDGPAWGSAVICHPHPQHGGSKDHPLLWAIRAELARRGLAVLGFNFRGVMGSQGSHAGGVLEVEDVRAAISRVRETVEGPTIVAGWSFGATVALREALDDDRAGALALVAIPLGDAAERLIRLPEPPELAGLAVPALIVVGDGDSFAPVPEAYVLAGRIPRAEVAVVAGTNHFFWRREREAAALVGAFAERTLREGSPP